MFGPGFMQLQVADSNGIGLVQVSGDQFSPGARSVLSKAMDRASTGVSILRR